MKILYMVDTNILLGLFLIIINLYITKFLSKNTIQIRTLSLAVYSNVICLFSEAIYVISYNQLNQHDNAFLLLLIMYIICSLFGMLASCFWALFVKCYITKQEKFSSDFIITFIAPCIIGAVLISTSPLTNLVFSIGKLSINQVGIFRNIELFVIILYNIYCVFTIANNTHKISALEYSILVFLETIPLIGFMLNTINSTLMSSYYLFSLTLIICYLTLQDNLIYYDSTTGGITKKSFDTLMYNNLKEGFTNYTLIYTEISNYNKAVDKTFLIKTFSHILLQNLKEKNKMAYFGNNEFVIYLETIDEKNINDFIDNINKDLQKINLINKEKINYIYGYEICNNENKENLVMISYNKMYEKKINKKDVIV